MLYALLASGCLTVLILARVLTPSSSGLGTHQQLGLPPCTFEAITGHGCPGCGLTTSFAALARGQIGTSLQANPIGIFLFLVTALGVPWSIYRVFKPKPVERYLESWWLVISLAGLAVGMYIVWFIRILRGDI